MAHLRAGRKRRKQGNNLHQLALCDDFRIFVDDVVIGIDFGFNNPTAVVQVGIYDEKYLYLKQLLYETKLTNNDLIDRLKALGIKSSTVLKCDCADPERIEELRRAGSTRRRA